MISRNKSPRIKLSFDLALKETTISFISEADDKHNCAIEPEYSEKDILIVPSCDGKSYFVFEMLKYSDFR